MDEREKLINELASRFPKLFEISVGHVIGIAEFIEEDRKRIVAPLLREWPTYHLNNMQLLEICKNGVRETLKLAGLGGA